MFAETNRNMINDAVAHALRIDRYIERYGLETVEHLMDIGFALDRHIDWHKGVRRSRYPERHVVERERQALPYADLFGDAPPSVSYEVVGETLPPHPENDLLWFLIEYAPLEPWQQDVLRIIREESYYFYPQFLTKIINEGWASYWHAEIFHQWKGVMPHAYQGKGVLPGEMIEFGALHARVVHPGARFSVNPYYLGYSVLVDIERRWDEMRKEWDANVNHGYPEKNKGRPRPPSGREKLFEVRSTEDDISFLRNYLTAELIEKLHLFSYGSSCTHPPGQQCPHCNRVVITSRDRDAVREALLAPRYHYGAPRIVARHTDKNVLYLEHLDRSTTFLDRRYAAATLGYIAELWKRGAVYLLTSNEQGNDTSLSAVPK